MYIIILGQRNGTVAYIGPFGSYAQASKFMDAELSPKAQDGAKMHVKNVLAPEYVTQRKTVVFI